MYRTRLTRYPSQEVRVVTYKLRDKRTTEETEFPPVNARSTTELGTEVLEKEKDGMGATLTIAANSKTPQKSDTDPQKPGYGGLPRKTAFGLYAKRQIQRCGALVDMLISDPSDVVFLTGTLPGSTPEAMEAIARWSGYIVNGLKAWLALRVPDKKDFYVWERQKRGALHLHYAVIVADHAPREYILKNFHAQWVRLMVSVSEKSGVDVFGRMDGGTWATAPHKIQAYAQPVRKSVGAYLSKYCGKTANEEYVNQGAPLLYPSRWYGCSRPLLKILQENTEVVEVDYSRARDAAKEHENFVSLLQTVSDKCYSYEDKAGTTACAVAYEVQHTLAKLWTLTTNKPLPMQTSNENLNPLPQVLSYSEHILRRYFHISTGRYTRLGHYSQNCMVKLLRCEPLSITEYTTVASDTVYLLHFRLIDQTEYLSEAGEAERGMRHCLKWVQSRAHYLGLTGRDMMSQLG